MRPVTSPLWPIVAIIGVFVTVMALFTAHWLIVGGLAVATAAAFYMSRGVAPVIAPDQSIRAGESDLGMDFGSLYGDGGGSTGGCGGGDGGSAGGCGGGGGGG